MEMLSGPATTSFKGDLAKMVGFSEISISEDQIDSAFALIDLSPPRWLKELFPGIRIEIDQAVTKKVNRNLGTMRFFAKYAFLGASFTISDPRVTTPQESARLKNQIKSVSLAISGDAEGLATHLGKMALADANRVKPFFSQRYDIEFYADLKPILAGNQLLLEWGKNGKNNLDYELSGGIRLTADPSPVVDLGTVLFIKERIDSLMEGGILAPVENITDAVAAGIQTIVFGKFKDPRVVPSLGWYARPQLIANLGGSFSLLFGTELSIQNHLTIKGTKPMTSFYGFAGIRWKVLGSDH